MMKKHTLLTALMIAASAMPMTAYAYLSPEEVISEDADNPRFVAPPPRPGDTDAVVEEQQRKSAERRAKEQAELMGTDASNDQTHGAAPDTMSDAQLQELLKQLNEKLGVETDTATTMEESEAAKDARLLERIKERQLEERIQAQAAAQAAYYAQTQSLHSGAPLSHTGPATTFALILSVLAVVGTMFWAMRLERMGAIDHTED